MRSLHNEVQVAAEHSAVLSHGQGRLGYFFTLLRSAAVGTYQANCFGIAKGAAYSALLSFFPVLTTLATLLVQARANEVARTIAGFLYDAVPPGTEEVVRRLFVVHGSRPTSLLVGAVLIAAWAGSGVVLSLMEGFRSIYHIPSGRGFVRDRGMAIFLVFTAIIPVWAASALLVIGARSEREIISWFGVSRSEAELEGWVSFVGQFLRYGVAFGTFVLVTAMVYFFGPNRTQRFRQLFPGAALATVLWFVATIAFGWWVRHVANFNVLYGSVGAGLALLAWMYVLAVITLFGCEFNAVRERSGV
jgi:membrane protein